MEFDENEDDFEGGTIKNGLYQYFINHYYGFMPGWRKNPGGDKMKLSYKKLWVMLVERDMKKTEFAKKAGISSASLAKLGKGANITTDVLVRVCETLNCDISDIAEIVPEEAAEEKKE